MPKNSNPWHSTSINLHDLTLTFQTLHHALFRRFETVYGHLPRQTPIEKDEVTICWQLENSSTAPLPPPSMTAISETGLVDYYGGGQRIAIRMPKYGLISVDLASQELHGQVTENCLTAYGAFEDVMMISLAPLYRRRGWFPLHAFAALSPHGQAALITGAMGAGKTTTGLALLDAGWKLLSNDSPLLRLRAGMVEALSYPGRLSAFDDSLARFDRLRRFIPPRSATGRDKPPQKQTFRAEEAFEEPWADAGVVGGVFFPKIVEGSNRSELELVEGAAAMVQLMPQAIEGWDKATIGSHLKLLSALVQQAPCYRLHLSPHVTQLPRLLAEGMQR